MSQSAQEAARDADAVLAYLADMLGMRFVGAIRAGDDTPPLNFVIDVAALARAASFSADDGAALAVACTADADAIEVAPQIPTVAAARGLRRPRWGAVTRRGQTLGARPGFVARRRVDAKSSKLLC